MYFAGYCRKYSQKKKIKFKCLPAGIYSHDFRQKFRRHDQIVMPSENVKEMPINVSLPDLGGEGYTEYVICGAVNFKMAI